MNIKNTINIGEILYKDRVKQKIPQTELFRGLCLQSDMSKYENGKKIPDKLFLDALMQRLGRCSDTLEPIMSETEYELYDMRECLQRNFYKKDYKKNKTILERYARRNETVQPLHQQFLAKYNAMNEYHQHGEFQRCLAELETSLEITFPEWKSAQLQNYYLCSQELHLLILIAYFWLREEKLCAIRQCTRELYKENAAVLLLEEIAAYIEERYFEEEKVKLFPHCMWLLALYWYEKGQWERSLQYSTRGIDCQIKNGMLPQLLEMTELKIKCLEQTGNVQPEMYAEADALRWILKEYGEWVLDMDELSVLHYFCHEDEIKLVSETIREIRQNQGIPQDELLSCTQSTISRIENGRQKPSYRHFKEMVHEMGVDKEYWISRVYSNDYDLYQIAHWRNRAVFLGNLEESSRWLKKLEKELDMTVPINQQYIETCHLEERTRRKELDKKEGIRQLIEILRYTMPDYREGKLRTPSRQECTILLKMASYKISIGQTKEGMDLYAQLLKIYDESKVRPEYHTNSILLLLKAYAGYLEIDNQLELSEEMHIRGMKMAIRCGQVDMLGHYLANLACVYQKSTDINMQKICKDQIRTAYWLYQLTKQENHAAIIRKYYLTEFQEDITHEYHHPKKWKN